MQQSPGIHWLFRHIKGKHLSQSIKDQAETDGDEQSRVVDAVARDTKRILAEPLASGLYIVATPIGNLGDITLRALGVLARADVVCCEDTRHSAKLLAHFAIRATTRALHDHNEEGEIARILGELDAGKSIALISDAGTPLVSDPGFKLVRAAAAAGHSVTIVPGSSALISALAVSGLPTDAFFFGGFLPAKQAARRARIQDLKSIPGTLIFYEAPQRVAEALADLTGVLGDRPAVMARELTKLHEELARGTLQSLAKDVAARDLKGEVVLVIGPPLEREVGDDEITERLEAALQSMRLKDAAKAVADALGVPKTRVYDIGLKVKGKAE
jgi:16S rRNA (cytidine1402-2'-O)-methyltransferase